MSINQDQIAADTSEQNWDDAEYPYYSDPLPATPATPAIPPRDEGNICILSNIIMICKNGKQEMI